MSNVSFGTDIQAVRKRVHFYNRESSAITIYEGMPLCYIFDSTTNELGYDVIDAEETSTTDEGHQNEGKFLQAEIPNDDNLLHFAGVVASGGWRGKSVAATSWDWVDIYIANGAVVPVRCDVDTVTGKTILAIQHDQQELGYALSATQARPVAIAMETETGLDTTAGITLAKLCPNEFIYQELTGTALIAATTGTDDVVVNRIKVTSAQTGGRLTALDVQSASTAGADSNGYGASLYVQGDLTGVAASHWNPFGCWANITGGTQSGTHLTVAEFGIYASGANLDAVASLSCITLRNQVSSTNPPDAVHNVIRVVQDGGGDSADFLFSFYTPETVGLATESSAAVSHVIPINVENAGGGTAGTYYIMVSDAA